jgi:type I restriction enzyme, S subunit
MNEPLPKGWVRVTIEDVAVLVRGVTFKKADASTEPGPGLVPIARAGNIQPGRANLDEDLVFVPRERVKPEQFLVAGDVVVATSSGSASVVGKSAVISDDWHGAHGAFMGVLRSRGSVHPSFLGYFVQSRAVRKEWREAAAGTNINNLKRGDLLSAVVPLAPLAEQERIVAVIEEQLSRLDAAEAALNAGLARLSRYWARTLDVAFSEFEVRLPVGEVAEVKGGIQKQPKRKPKHNPAPFLRVANVLRGQTVLDEVHQIELFEGELDKYRLRDGDLLVVEGNGSPAQIGRAARWHGEIGPCVHQNHLIRVRPGPNLDPDFLDLYWNAPSTANVLREVASSTSGLYTLSTRKVKAVPVPSAPIEEQRLVARSLRETESMVRRMRQQLEVEIPRSGNLRRSILDAAFSGQLVAQDPVDEPASILLERIAAVRAAPKTRRKTSA